MMFPSVKALTAPAIQNREQLIQALHTASELEHMLACEYLFTAFTIRRKLSDFPLEVPKEQRLLVLERSRLWLGQILLVARQEMEHLGIVMNLLAAVGADPYFERPPFPQPAQLVDAPLCLDRFGLTSMRRFIWYERPSFLTPDFPAECLCTPAPAPKPTRVTALGIHTIQELYDNIAAAFQTLPPAEVFQGNTDRQLPQPTFGYAINLATITNVAEAQAAVAQILIEGEGIGELPVSDDAHYQKFLVILDGLNSSLAADPAFDPALPVITNPMIGMPSPEGPGNRITDPVAVAVMRFFNDAYQTMLVMLHTFFKTYSFGTVPQPRPQSALFYAAFFPLMTMVVRPVAEILVRLPAGPEYPGQNAGPSFEIDGPILFEPSVEWNIVRLEHLAKSAQALIDVVPPAYRFRMTFIYENLTSTRIHLGDLWQHGK